MLSEPQTILNHGNVYCQGQKIIRKRISSSWTLYEFARSLKPRTQKVGVGGLKSNTSICAFFERHQFGKCLCHNLAFSSLFACKGKFMLNSRAWFLWSQSPVFRVTIEIGLWVFLFIEEPRSRCYGRTAALSLIVQPCDEDDEVFSAFPV
jgi:hypothetical protein